MQHTEIIKAIEAHAKDFNLTVGTIGQLSVQNSRVYDNLVAGRDIQIRTADRLAKWLDEDRTARTARAKVSS